MSGDARARGAGSGAAAFLIGLLAVLQAAGPGPRAVQVGKVQAIYWPGDQNVATALADEADRATDWPGIPNPPHFPVRLFVVRSEARYDSITRDRLPSWSGAAAFPAMHTIVLKLDGDPRVTLRHEMAHLVLHHIAPAVPLWFDEGYAAVAAGEWNRLDVLTVNLALARGAVPTFASLDRSLRAGATEAEASYALATTAVLFLQRLGGERGLTPLLTNLRETHNFETAVRRTHLVTVDQLEKLWQHDLRSRYGWVTFFTSFTVFWGGIGLGLVALWGWRRRRDRERRDHLDDDWTLPPEEGASA